MKLHVDADACDLHGQCAYVAPDLFRFDDAGKLAYVTDVPHDQEQAARRAVAACPMRAIETTS